MPPIVVRAPATSANLGPGFDCLGISLGLWNDVVAQPADADDVESSDGSFAPAPRENLILRSAQALFAHVGAAGPPLEIRCANRIPFGRGLGSSAAAIASGLLIGNRVLGDPLGTADLVNLAAQIEGHPDNVVPCLLGGMRAAVCTESGVVHARVPLALPLMAVVFIPEVTLSTKLAREALPPHVKYADALFNVARSALLIAALASGEAAALREATRDRLHQPYREPLFPAGMRLIAAARDAGALGACISGAGPSVLALCRDTAHADEIAGVLDATAARIDTPGRSMILPISEQGAHIVYAE